jgi:calmodulin
MAKPATRTKKLTREDTSQVLKDDLVKDLASAFALFKGNSRDRLGREELRPILKQFNITGANVEEMIKEGDVTNAGSMELSEFITMMANRLRRLDPRSTVLKAFEVFDPRKEGWIPTDVLYEALTQTGDKLSEAEVDEMLRTCEKDKKVYYHKWLDVVYGMKPQEE